MSRSLMYLPLLMTMAYLEASSQHILRTPDRTLFSIHWPPSSQVNAVGEASPFPPMRDEQGSLALTIGSSAVLGVAGFFVGGLTGSALATDCAYFDCIEPIILGVLIGTPVGTAVGAHVGNGRRGRLGYDLLAGLGGSAVGLLILAADSDSGITVLLAGASVVALPVIVERRSAARRAGSGRVNLSAAPTRHGFTVGLNVSVGG